MRAARLVAAGREQVGHHRLQDGEALGRDRALAAASRAAGWTRCTSAVGAACGGAAPSCSSRTRSSALVISSTQLGRARAGPPGRRGRAASGRAPRASAYGVVEESRAVVLVTQRAVAADAPLDQPGAVGRDADRRDLVASRRAATATRSRQAVASNSAGMRKSRSRRVAKRTSPRMRERRKVRIASRSWSRPTRYHWPSRRNRLYGSIVRVDLLVGRDRPVREEDRALLGDRRLELLQALRDLGACSRCRAGCRLTPRRRRPRSGSAGRAPGSAARAAAARRRRTGPRAGRRRVASAASSASVRCSGGRKYCSRRSVYSSSPVNSSRCEGIGTPRPRARCGRRRSGARTPRRTCPSSPRPPA